MKLHLPVSQAHLVPGYRLDRYELLMPYAQGGMATVWVGRLRGKHGFEKLVAIKTILPQYANEPMFRTMFLDEARIASRIRHPNVAEIDDLGEEDGVLYLVLEWIEGESLGKLYEAVQKAGQPFPFNLLLRVCADACAGLHAAHGLRDSAGELLNVVHRDVSPQNLLVSNLGVTKVIDFGIAKARDRMGEATKTGLLKGKAEYAAPEQALMKPVDCRADVWAMGVILYQLLSGHLPYEGKNDLDTLRMLASGKKPKALPSSVPQSVRDVVARALTPNVDERLPTALDLQRALEASMTAPFSQADVAAFVNTFLADRIAAKKRDVEKALADAALREEGAPPLRAPMTSSPELGARPRMASVPPSEPRPRMPSIPEARPPMPSAPPARAPMPSQPEARAPVPSRPPPMELPEDARPTERMEPPPVLAPLASPPAPMEEAPTLLKEQRAASRGRGMRVAIFTALGLLVASFTALGVVMLTSKPAREDAAVTASHPAEAAPSPPAPAEIGSKANPPPSPSGVAPPVAPPAASGDGMDIEILPLRALPPAAPKVYVPMAKASATPAEKEAKDDSKGAKPPEPKATDVKATDAKAGEAKATGGKSPAPKPTVPDDGF